MRKFTFSFKSLLVATLLLGGVNSAWAEVANGTTTTWLFNQFYNNDYLINFVTDETTKSYVYDFENLYICVGNGSTGATRSLQAKSAAMPNSTAPSAAEVTPFPKGTYIGLYYNAASRAWANTAADNNTQYNMASLKVNASGILYVLAFPSNEGRSINIGTYNSPNMETIASATRTNETGSNWFLLSCNVESNKRYFIGSQDGGWTLYGVKFVPTSDNNGRKTFNVNMSNGWATFSSCSNFAVPDGYKAYKAKVDENSAALTEIANIPANTGVILYGPEIASLTLSSVVSANADVSENDLVANIGSYSLQVNNGSSYNYTLALEAGSPVFKHSSGSGLLAAGKAYLRTTTNVSSVKKFSIIFDDRATEITSIQDEEVNTDDIYYNLSGQQVTKDYKGIVIVNGKKFYNK